MNKGEAKRILIFNVNWLGDVLFSTASIRNIRRNHPDSFIACIVPSRCYPVLKGNPHLDEIIIFDEKDRHKNVFSQLDFVKKLKAKKFDTVFLIHRSFSRALICRLAGIPNRIGYYTRKRGFLLTKKITMPSMESMHRIDYYLNILEKAGLKIEDRFTEFFFDEEDKAKVETFLEKNSVKKDDFLVVLNPGGNWFPKRWPKEYWASLADDLIFQFKTKVVITGAHNDIHLVNSIARLMKEKAIIATGIFNIKQLGALAKRSDLFVTADTGPLHIANAVGARKIFAIFGPTSVELTGPFPLKNVTIFQKNTGCKVPCYEVNCKDNRCMKAVTPGQLLESLPSLLKK